MKYEKIIKGKFVDRPNRFIAHVEVEGKIETVHVKNTGRCQELLIPGAEVILEDFRLVVTERKTKFDLIAVYKDTIIDDKDKKLLINMDSQAPNKVTNEWLLKSDYSYVKPEYIYGESRIDFYMEKQTSGSLQKWLLEIKGCTLEKNGIGFFPDAPTERGVKHLKELTNAKKQGFNCAVGFVIQMEGIEEVRPNIETHPEFGTALAEARSSGVEVWFFLCRVKEENLEIVEMRKA